MDNNLSVNKYIKLSFQDFLENYELLKKEWLHENTDAEEIDFDKFYNNLYTANKEIISEFTYKKISDFFVRKQLRNLDTVIKNFHDSMNESEIKKEGAVSIESRSLAKDNVFVDKYFESDSKMIDLISYLVIEFEARYVKGRINKNTLFDHLYIYLNKKVGEHVASIAKKDYKNFVKNFFGFEIISALNSNNHEKYEIWFKSIEKDFSK